jgi:hypothetical protein
MDKQAKLEYQQKVEKYLADNRVYDLFEDLLKALVVKQPDNPIGYMIDKLSETPSIISCLFSKKDIHSGTTRFQSTRAGPTGGRSL